jgi:hypothetical protein
MKTLNLLILTIVLFPIHTALASDLIDIHSVKTKYDAAVSEYRDGAYSLNRLNEVIKKECQKNSKNCVRLNAMKHSIITSLENQKAVVQDLFNEITELRQIETHSNETAISVR